MGSSPTGGAVTVVVDTEVTVAELSHDALGTRSLQYAIDRALRDLTQAEFMWERHPGAWGIRRRDECSTPTPLGAKNGEWVADFDKKLAAAADRGKAVEPMTTIGWLLNHFGSTPALAAKLEILGGDVSASKPGIWKQMWSNTIYSEVDDVVAVFHEGWSAVGEALRATTDEMLEKEYKGYGGPDVGAVFLLTRINEIGHHATQICSLRGLYRQVAT